MLSSLLHPQLCEPGRLLSCVRTGSVSPPGSAPCPEADVCAILRWGRCAGSCTEVPAELSLGHRCAVCAEVCVWGETESSREHCSVNPDGPPREPRRAQLRPRDRLPELGWPAAGPRPSASHSPGASGFFHLSSAVLMFENKITSCDDSFTVKFKSKPPFSNDESQIGEGMRSGLLL